MTTRSFHRDAARVEPGRLRLLAAAALEVAGLALRQLAQALLRLERPAAVDEPVLEFHAGAGAPEGALYVDGQLVGTLRGINRL